MAQITPSEWDKFLAQYPDAHILQTSIWGQLKAEFGWRVLHFASQHCGAQLMVKQFLPGLRFAYIPKGPVGMSWSELWPEVDQACRQLKCISLKIEPDVWVTKEGESAIQAEQIPAGFTQSQQSIQPRRTLVVDISSDEQHILAQMKQKTRYNINLAIKKDVVVRPHVDLGTFYHLMEITGERDQFGIHNLAYYQRAFDLFSAHDQCQLLLAEYESVPLGALIVFRNGKRAWYFYGASSDRHRERMPNYLLQWEAMRWAKSKGCTEYDLWGVPDEDQATLEADFTNRDRGLWGVYRFKRGFGGVLRRSAGPWDKIYHPILYKLYTLGLKYLKVEN